MTMVTLHIGCWLEQNFFVRLFVELNRFLKKAHDWC